ncbi:MAG: ATP-binding protein [Vicinamibacteria bacterium]
MPPVRKERVLLAWSSGKDAAWSLHVLRARGVEVVGLLTTVDAPSGRVAMHDIRRELVRRQAESVDLPLVEVGIPWPCPNEIYEAAMAGALADARGRGVTAVAFGDLFLEDVRRYREERMAGTGLGTLFPLWGRPTRELAEEMLAAGQKAVLATVDCRVLPAELAGQAFDESLLERLPKGVDPCGENGEFHTFAWDGPAFRSPVPVRTGPIVARDGFAYADVLPS